MARDKRSMQYNFLERYLRNRYPPIKLPICPLKQASCCSIGSRTGCSLQAMAEQEVGVQVLLTGVPLEKGLYTVTGCNVTSANVSWHQPWSPAPPTLASVFKPPSI